MARKGLRYCQESPGFLMARDKNIAQKCEKDNDPWAHEWPEAVGLPSLSPAYAPATWTPLYRTFPPVAPCRSLIIFQYIFIHKDV